MNNSAQSSQKKQRSMSPSRKRKRSQQQQQSSQKKRQTSPKRRRVQRSQQLQKDVDWAKKKPENYYEFRDKIEELFSDQYFAKYNVQTLSELLFIILNNTKGISVKEINSALNETSPYVTNGKPELLPGDLHPKYYPKLMKVLENNDVGGHGIGKYQFPFIFLSSVAQVGTTKLFQNALILAGAIKEIKMEGIVSAIILNSKQDTKTKIQKLIILHKTFPRELSYQRLEQYLEEENGDVLLQQLRKQKVYKPQQIHLYT